MKNTFFKLLLVSMSLFFTQGCKEEEKPNVNLNAYSASNPVANTPLDQWLKANFFDKYNIQVNYRYDRGRITEVTKDVGPIDLDKVQPQMQAVLEGMLLPYERAAGTAFIKKVSPKEINIYGGSEFTSTGTSLLGIMMAGRQLNLYYANTYSDEDVASKARKLRTIHHEFGHAINQQISRPKAFDLVSAKYYAAANITLEKARELGFVTAYSSTEPGEDFADMLCYLLVNGQIWFDDWANGSTTAGKAALKEKEAIIRSYFRDGLGFEFKSLQNEVQKVVRHGYKFEEANLPKWLANGFFKTITINLSENSIYQNYAMPGEFTAVHKALKDGIAAKSSLYNLRMGNEIQFRFTAANKLTVRLSYTATTGGWAGNTYMADFDFSYQLNTATGEITFTKVNQPTTGGNYDAANFIYSVFQNSIQAYLTGKTFVTSWLPVNIDADNYNKYGGFYLKGTPTNYFYGLLGQTL